MTTPCPPVASVMASSPIANIPLRIKNVADIDTALPKNQEDITSPISDATLDHEIQPSSSYSVTPQNSRTSVVTLQSNSNHFYAASNQSSITTTLLQNFNLSPTTSISQTCQICNKSATKVLYHAQSNLRPSQSTLSDNAISICADRNCGDAAKAHIEIPTTAVEEDLESSKGRKEVVDCRVCGRQSLRAICAVCQFACKWLVTYDENDIKLTFQSTIIRSETYACKWWSKADEKWHETTKGWRSFVMSRSMLRMSHQHQQDLWQAVHHTM